MLRQLRRDDLKSEEPIRFLSNFRPNATSWNVADATKVRFRSLVCRDSTDAVSVRDAMSLYNIPELVISTMFDQTPFVHDCVHDLLQDPYLHAASEAGMF